MVRILYQAIERARALSKPQKYLFAAAAAVVTAWLILIFVILSRQAGETLSEFQLDKAVHFCGGVLAATLIYAYSGKARGKYVISGVLIIGILWEIAEVALLRDQYMRFRAQFPLWFFDTIFDIVADVLGAYFWVNIQQRQGGEPHRSRGGIQR